MADIARREAEADGAAFSKIAAALGLFGVATASLIINLAAACDPPPAYGGNTYYHLALVGSFFAGMGQVGAAIWVADDQRGRHAVGKKIMIASIAPLVVAVGLTGAALLW
uniref:Uncharacterized protein n=1 Tax=Oryza glumipatula TaxID=40148 RepID=A0A0D9Y361_9ORYZ